MTLGHPSWLHTFWVGTNLRRPLRRQRTIARPAEVAGFGYWSGQDVRIEFRPAAADTGLVFVREDLPGQPRIPADVRHRIEAPRRTTLAANGANVEMVEHVLAALYALEIDNCEIAVNAAELPGCDGSCQSHIAALQAAGVETASAARKRLVITDVARVGDEDCWVEARPNKKDELAIEYKLDYGPNNSIGRQKIQLAVTPESFVRELSTARTFLLEGEARWLRERGMGTRVTSKDLLVFGDEGVIDNELRFEDECVRHKALDLVGDLALCGCELIGQVIAYKSGHRLNAELVQVLLTEGRLEEGLRRTG